MNLPQAVKNLAICCLSAGVFVAAGLSATQAANRVSLPEKPNIVFIMVDDMGYADLGCYGGNQIQTPNIDRLAARGMRFTQAYSGCTVCAPARSTLMTGYHMGHTSVRSNSGGASLRDDDVTVPEVLNEAGYVSGGFGKWGLGDVRTPGVPERQGFETFFGYYHQVHAHSYYPEYLWHSGRKVLLPGNADGARRQYTHYDIFDETLKFIRKNEDRPFFCYAPWTPPHDKYEIPDDEPAVELYKDKPWPEDAKVVAAMDTMIDRHVGQLVGLLEELKLDRRTIVFFCSDNGAAQRFDGVLDSSGPLKGRKRSMYEGGIRVPMIAYWPGEIEAGTTSDLCWAFHDFLPTAAELAGVDSPKGIDGISIVPTLLGEDTVGRKQQQHEYLYWEYENINWKTYTMRPETRMQAVRMGNWKGVRPAPNDPLEVYDLSTDLGEERNLAADKPEIAARLESILKSARTDAAPQIEPDMPAGKRFR